MQHLVTLKEKTAAWVAETIELATNVKANPGAYADHMHRKTLFMGFEKPSLRTRVSFEVGMTQMGGHAIYYDFGTSPLGAGKETLQDTVRTICRYSDVIMARLFEHAKIEEMARHATVPVINGLTDFSHPCQILADLLTVREHKGKLAGLTLAYLGDSNNNVTHSLLYGCSMAGMAVRVGCPGGGEYTPAADVVEFARATASETGREVVVTHDAVEAVQGADVVYTDSWMSYHIPKDQLEARQADLMPFQVNAKLMSRAAPDAIFMNCLPAMRGFEQSADVMDGPQSVVFDQAENRLHAQKAIMLKLTGLA
jgi:ornithine carbamoyltransferase